MTLPPEFLFSQGNLQDYVDCRRRFQLRYLHRLAWPAVEAEPLIENERRLQMGALFHRLVQQHWLGLPPERLSGTAKDEDLKRWWHNYLQHFGDHAGLLGLIGLSHSTGIEIKRYPEITLSTPLSGYSLVAKYDAITHITLAHGERVVVFDWKTSAKRPPRRWLAERLQSRVYPYLLVKVGAHLCEGKPIQPEQVEMVYWFADYPTQPERFSYDSSQHEQDGEYLATLVEEIEGLKDEEYYLTEHEERCLFCTYRSLCERGVAAGSLQQAKAGDDRTLTETGEDFEIAFDFEQIAEIGF